MSKMTNSLKLIYKFVIETMQPNSLIHSSIRIGATGSLEIVKTLQRKKIQSIQLAGRDVFIIGAGMIESS